MRSNKVFKTIDEQIEIFKSKGLIINDIDNTTPIIVCFFDSFILLHSFALCLFTEPYLI